MINNIHHVTIHNLLNIYVIFIIYPFKCIPKDIIIIISFIYYYYYTTNIIMNSINSINSIILLLLLYN